MAILAAILLPTLVATAGWWSGELRRQETVELRQRLISQEAELRRLREEIDLLEGDLELLLDLD